MKKSLPILILCMLLVLPACGKKQATPEGSGSAEQTIVADTSGKSISKPGKSGNGHAAETTAPASESSPAQPGTSGRSGTKTTPAPSAAPTPKIENWSDVQQFQEELLENLTVNPVGNWADKSTGAAMVIDEAFRGSILLPMADGSAAVWVFTGSYDENTGALSYSDGMKQVHGASGLQTAYQNSRGTLTVKDGALVWQDGKEIRSYTFQRGES